MKKEITKYYNDLAKNYDADRFSNSYGQYIHRQENKILKKYLDEKNIDFNLDLACGTGRFLKYANYGIDISEKMVEISKTKYPQKKIAIGDAENLPYKNTFFENVIAFHLFMHLDQSYIKKILCEVNRVSKKGAYFIFDVPSAKRRKLTGYRSSNWHGGNQLSTKTLKKIIGEEWRLVASHGTAFLPIHRLSEKLRKRLVNFDSFMCNSFFKEYSSHLIFILEKK